MKIQNLINCQPILLKLILNISVLFTVIVIIYFFVITDEIKQIPQQEKKQQQKTLLNNYNVWLIFTKATEQSSLHYKFRNLLKNLLNVTSVPLMFHIIADENSRKLVNTDIQNITKSTCGKFVNFTLYDVKDCAEIISDIVEIMVPHFSSKPGTYYSDSLFYISLGLYRIAPNTQNNAILLDCDLYFKRDIALLFKQFEKFKPTALFGLAPELTPVYKHILHKYKAKHKTTFGEYYHEKNINLTLHQQPHPRGFQGYNSGVVLMKLDAIRKSEEYRNTILNNRTVNELTNKYQFRGHLGDQDYYTLIGYEYPHLIQTLNCGFNRQLCVWWRDHGYNNIFNNYFKCNNHSIVVLHGNCNTKIPEL